MPENFNYLYQSFCIVLCIENQRKTNVARVSFYLHADLP